MFVPFALAALLARTAFVHADPTPSEPGPGSVYNEGSNCFVSWDVDTTGVWKTMNIELMAGDNFDMQYLTTVATVDGTDPNNNSFSYPCPAVHPNSPVFFYQFTSPYSTQVYWTTRFTIADASGNVTPPTETTQPGGAPTPWGTAALDNAADAVPSPALGESAAGATATAAAPTMNTSPIVSVAAAGSGSVLTYFSASVASGWSLASTPVVVTVSQTANVAQAASTASGTGNVPASGSPAQGAPNSLQTVRSSATGSAGTPGTSAITSSNVNGTTNANAALVTLSVDRHVFRGALALGVAAFTFAIAL
ncbi:hypothetical protein OBBRIDRAFT_837310 [Obba rivulosa]|uniref:Ser-Thr-rich glycosyl-phosphatidyl-inositol-anchored membrane family-domain-containing protein n=1 Tax=Obba rivulosa TaxID=1052685 RepID=A0A8E2DI13_9APHY|nr:hypothetical protein OBBRIDRAFT_837310 [Obba rivulosa]